MSDTEDPSLTGLLQRIRARATQEVRILLPARVERFDADRQCVDAQPWIDDVTIQADGTLLRERLQVATNCPVMYPRSGPYAITFPIAVGSTVMLAFTSASLDRFLAIGGSVDPEDPRRHTISDAVAYPGGHSFAGSTAPSTSAPTDAMVHHAPALLLGGPTATDPIAQKSDLETFMTALDEAIVTLGSPGGAILEALKTRLVHAGWPVCASVVKAL